MAANLLTVQLRSERDVVAARQRARQIAELLGFGTQEQTRIATAVSEIARNAYRYASGGRVEFAVASEPDPSLEVRVSDCGGGIPQLQEVLSGHYRSTTGMGIGISGARRLMDTFSIHSGPGEGTRVAMSKRLLPTAPALTPQSLSRISRELAAQGGTDPMSELQQQNQELLRTLGELRERQTEIERLNDELEDTNRGVLALYADLDEKALALQQASELKSRFLSYMSHEFRSPLNSILSLSRLLLDRVDGPLTSEQQKQVEFVSKSANQLYELVNDLLDLAKIEAGKIDIHPARFSVAELFGALRGMFRPLVTSEAVTLTVEAAADIPDLYTDEGKVSQILRNFTSNALKFTERGEVRISARRGDNDTVVLSVSDTGIGIADEDQERIFEEFAQVRSSLQKRVKGTGLGLPLSQKLAELLGGTISVQSSPGVGSTFTVTLPRVHPGPEGTPPADLLTPGASSDAGAAQEQPAAETILLIDDDAAARYLLRGLLSATRYTVTEATGALEGLRLARAQRPRAIFLDLMMPDLSGFEVLERLKADPATADIPVIINSGRTLDERERRGLSQRATAILSKERMPREVAVARMQEALLKAGLDPSLSNPGAPVGESHA